MSVELLQSKVPLKHLAVIMDGNGRWAERRGHSRIFGHVQGAKTARSLIKICARGGLRFLSLFALSSENILRPQAEVASLQKLLEKVFLKHSSFLMKEQIQLRIIGDVSVFSSSLKKLINDLLTKTRPNKGLCLIVALNYGGRQEIIQAVKKAAQAVQKNQIPAQNIDEKLASSYFESSAFPPPDLIIRTGGRARLSNFYLWSAAYSELYFTNRLWPDFGTADLSAALASFEKAKRQFGLLKKPSS